MRGVDADELEHQPLCASVAITERVDDVELAVVVRQAATNWSCGSVNSN